MAKKTFISYKYSEASELRDEILKSLGDDATYYQGERADSPDLTGDSVESIKEKLKDKIYSTSVTIVIISPNVKQSKWIDWEIEYALKRIKRGDKTSRTNGVVGVIMKHNGSYDWFMKTKTNQDGCSSRYFEEKLVYDIINNNRFNKKGDDVYTCPVCKTYNALDGSYISYVTEDNFLKNPNRYIDNAFDKSQKEDDGYTIVRQK